MWVRSSTRIILCHTQMLEKGKEITHPVKKYNHIFISL